MKKIQCYIGTKCQKARNQEDKQVNISIIYARTIWVRYKTTTISANTVEIPICNKNNTTLTYNIIKSKCTEDKRMLDLSGNTTRNAR